MNSRSPVRRPFTLLDGMILVAATACGCGVDSWINSLGQTPSRRDLLHALDEAIQKQNYPMSAYITLILLIPILAAWTLALIPLRLIAPRPSRRVLASQPGWMCCCAFAICLVFAAFPAGGLLLVKGASDPDALVEFLPILPMMLTPAILTAWLGLILGRRWRPEPGWLDRSGRALGVFWIILGIVGPILLATLM